jgi:molybdopterin converting factor subunit 1
MTIRVLFFAYLRERCGREARVEVPEGASIADLWTQLRAQHPVLQDATVRFALNCVYVDKTQVLHDDDELALIPPVSGGSMAAVAHDGVHDSYLITSEAIDVAAVLAAVTDARAGGIALFVGTTRDENDGRRVVRLEYEAYEDMAIREMRAIGAEMRQRWPLVGVAMVHRIGVVPTAETSVAIAVSSPHRDEAFAACRHGIDRLKALVPIWKKEYYADGSRWIGSCHADQVIERLERIEPNA